MTDTMQAEPPREPTLTDVLTELREFKANVDQRFEQVDRRFEQIEQQFEQRLDKLDYKFDTYENASDKLVRLATTIIIAAATVAILPSAFQAFGPLVTQLVSAGQ
ncbi:hypothetical protein [Nodosilinea nodulosa]|uniref:hypothetical protein n=1 Tax=Nodosilinea nodulosa TaxID=416001 RepID=UPI0002F18F0B|nr:hypothetical protein [Nodosilinea nodulosa]